MLPNNAQLPPSDGHLQWTVHHCWPLATAGSDHLLVRSGVAAVLMDVTDWYWWVFNITTYLYLTAMVRSINCIGTSYRPGFIRKNRGNGPLVSRIRNESEHLPLRFRFLNIRDPGYLYTLLIGAMWQPRLPIYLVDRCNVTAPVTYIPCW